MKKNLPFLIVFALILACSIVSPPAAPSSVQGVETIVAQTVNALPSAAPSAPLPAATQAMGTWVSYENIRFFLPQALGTNALAGVVPEVQAIPEAPTWDVAPRHIKFQVENYPLYGTFHEPAIRVIPAQKYAAGNENAKQNINQLNALLNGMGALAPENLPGVVFFNAGQTYAAQMQIISFQNGKGIRFLTQYAQYFATANNKDMIYEFQGLTNDGKYYILAILPASHPSLAADEDPVSPLPAGGIPFPGYEDQTGLQAYYPSIQNLLNSSPQEQFTPSLSTLDALIQSISIAP